jgi:polyhydroxyalkanoate synthesis regulator phasin
MPDKTQKLNKLKELMKLLDESLTKADFTAAFSAVMKQILTLEQNLIKKIDIKTQSATDTLAELKKEYKDTIAKIKEENQSSFSNMKRWAISQVNELFIKYQLKEKLAVLDERMANIKDGKDGAPADEVKIVKDVLTKIPSPKELTPEQTRDKLESIKEETEKLDILAIRNLRKELDELKKQGGTRFFGGGGLSRGVADSLYAPLGTTGVLTELPATETPDGTNTIFTFTEKPTYILSDGVKLKENAGWTFSGLQATLTVPPQFSIWGEK